MHGYKRGGVFAALLLCPLSVAKTQAQTAYTIQDLGPFDGLGAGVAGLNNNGDLTATTLGLTGGSGYIYSQGTLQSVLDGSVGNINDAGWTPLPNLDFPSGQASGQATLYNIHTGQSQIVGSASTSDSASVVNQNGDAAGVTTVPYQAGQILSAALFRNGQTFNLGNLTSGGKSSATALNNHDDVTGCGQTASGKNHAFLYTNGSLRDLGTLSGDNASQANGINDSGQVVGVSSGAAGSRAFLYQNGAMRDLGTLGGPSSIAYGINNAGVIVGAAQTQAGSAVDIVHAFVYSDGMMRDLFAMAPDAANWGFGSAEAINDRGQVAGIAIHRGLTGNTKVLFIATPVSVPEPNGLRFSQRGCSRSASPVAGFAPRKIRAFRPADPKSGWANACRRKFPPRILTFARI